jgi:hypothetical protein
MRRIFVFPRAFGVAVRHFDSTQQIGREGSWANKIKDMPVLTGNPRPVSAEGDWRCEYRLNERMEAVIPQVLRKIGFSDEEIHREVSQIFGRKQTGSQAALNVWSTVEEFQRTPWYRRFKPTDATAAQYISFEAMKALEAALVPPSMRTDPYAHLRKRHLEDNWLNQNFSEQHAQYIRRDDLKNYTKGTSEYGKVTRRDFLKFEKEYKAKHGGMPTQNEVYASWQGYVRQRKKLFNQQS